MDIVVLCTILMFCFSFLIAKRIESRKSKFRHYTFKNGVIYSRNGVQVGIYFKRTMVLNMKYIDYSDLSPEDFKYIKTVTEKGGYDGNGGE